MHTGHPSRALRVGERALGLLAVGFAGGLFPFGLLALALVAGGCQRSVAAPDPMLEGALPEPAPERGPGGEPLLEASEVEVSGVRLPVDLDPTHEVDGAPVFRTSHRAARVLSYFTARHGEGSLERIGEGGVLRGVPVQVSGAARRVDISILGRSTGGARVHVLLLPTSVAGPTDPAERVRAYAEHLRTLD